MRDKQKYCKKRIYCPASRFECWVAVIDARHQDLIESYVTRVLMFQSMPLRLRKELPHIPTHGCDNWCMRNRSVASVLHSLISPDWEGEKIDPTHLYQLNILTFCVFCVVFWTAFQPRLGQTFRRQSLRVQGHLADSCFRQFQAMLAFVTRTYSDIRQGFKLHFVFRYMEVYQLTPVKAGAYKVLNVMCQVCYCGNKLHFSVILVSVLINHETGSTL